jgi:hypothetical protein
VVKGHIRRMETLVNRLAAVIQDQRAPTPRRLQTAQDVVDLLQEQVEALRAEARADAVPKARAVGYLADLARKAIETTSLAARLDALENRVKPEPKAVKTCSSGGINEKHSHTTGTS